jgi:hypothetical protein
MTENQPGRSPRATDNRLRGSRQGSQGKAQPSPSRRAGSMTARLSLRSMIDAKCKECIYDPGPYSRGTWREQVAACNNVNCPLHPARPQPLAGKA